MVGVCKAGAADHSRKEADLCTERLFLDGGLVTFETWGVLHMVRLSQNWITTDAPRI